MKTPFLLTARCWGWALQVSNRAVTNGGGVVILLFGIPPSHLPPTPLHLLQIIRQMSWELKNLWIHFYLFHQQLRQQPQQRRLLRKIKMILDNSSIGEPIKAEIFQDGTQELLFNCLRKHFLASKHRKNPVSLIHIVANVSDICSQISHKS